jgi:hypothetical protein
MTTAANKQEIYQFCFLCRISDRPRDDKNINHLCGAQACLIHSQTWDSVCDPIH